MQEFTQSTEQKRRFHAAPKTAAGHPAKVDGIPAWNTADSTDGAAAPPPGTFVLTPDADGLSCELSGTEAGDLDLTCDADADLGAGVRDVSSTVRVHILAPEATALEITADDPTPA